MIYAEIPIAYFLEVDILTLFSQNAQNKDDIYQSSINLEAIQLQLFFFNNNYLTTEVGSQVQIRRTVKFFLVLLLRVSSKEDLIGIRETKYNVSVE